MNTLQQELERQKAYMAEHPIKRSVEQLKDDIKEVEAALKRQETGKYMHFTSGNIAILTNQLIDLKRELAKLEKE
jgi:predicted transcriptional regulator